MKKTLDFYCFLTSLKNDVNVHSKRNKLKNLARKKLIFAGVLKVTDEKIRIRSRSRTKMSQIRSNGWPQWTGCFGSEYVPAFSYYLLEEHRKDESKSQLLLEKKDKKVSYIYRNYNTTARYTSHPLIFFSSKLKRSVQKVANRLATHREDHVRILWVPVDGRLVQWQKGGPLEVRSYQNKLAFTHKDSNSRSPDQVLVSCVL